jgi:hypothetical protein
VIALSRWKPSTRVEPDHAAIDSAVLGKADEAAVRAFFEEIGAFDHLLVTATPPAPGGAFLESSYADAEAALRGKLLGSWACARHAAPEYGRAAPSHFSPGALRGLHEEP